LVAASRRRFRAVPLAETVFSTRIFRFDWNRQLDFWKSFRCSCDRNQRGIRIFDRDGGVLGREKVVRNGRGNCGCGSDGIQRVSHCILAIRAYGHGLYFFLSDFAGANRHLPGNGECDLGSGGGPGDRGSVEYEVSRMAPAGAGVSGGGNKRNRGKNGAGETKETRAMLDCYGWNRGSGIPALAVVHTMA